MKNWSRIIFIVIILLGGTMSFGFWSFSQFNIAVDNLSALSASVTNSYLPRYSQSPVIESDIIDSNIYLEVASSTDVTASSTIVSTDSADLKLKFIFPTRKSTVYIGCSYPIIWTATSTVVSLKTFLIDAGTLTQSGPIASGLARENTIDPAIQSLPWKVGVVWPGRYYISVTNVNGTSMKERSPSFNISEVPSELDSDQKKNLCESTGGSL